MSVTANTDPPQSGGCQKRFPLVEQRFILGKKLTLQKIKVFRTYSESGELLLQPKEDILKHRLAQAIIELKRFDVEPNVGCRPTIRDDLMEQFQFHKYEAIERLKDVCAILQKIESIDKNRDRMRTLRNNQKSDQEKLELILLKDDCIPIKDVKGEETPTSTDTALITADTDTTFSSVEYMTTDSEIESPTSDSNPDTNVYDQYTFVKMELQSDPLNECLLDLGIPGSYDTEFTNNESSVTSFNNNTVYTVL